MTATGAVAVGASVIAIQNSQRGREEREEQCVLFVDGFDSNNSSIKEKQAYSSCIETLYPEPVSDTDILVGKACVSVLLVALVVGIVWGWKQDGVEGAVIFGLGVPGAITAFGLLLLLVLAGVGFLFT